MQADDLGMVHENCTILFRSVYQKLIFIYEYKKQKNDWLQNDTILNGDTIFYRL